MKLNTYCNNHLGQFDAYCPNHNVNFCTVCGDSKNKYKTMTSTGECWVNDLHLEVGPGVLPLIYKSRVE